jgi:hypothetical protein
MLRRPLRTPEAGPAEPGRAADVVPARLNPVGPQMSCRCGAGDLGCTNPRAASAQCTYVPGAITRTSSGPGQLMLELRVTNGRLTFYPQVSLSARPSRPSFPAQPARPARPARLPTRFVRAQQPARTCCPAEAPLARSRRSFRRRCGRTSRCWRGATRTASRRPGARTSCRAAMRPRATRGCGW